MADNVKTVFAALTRNTSLEIGGKTIAPGKRQHIELPFGRLPTGSQQALPVTVSNGRFAGERLWLSGAVHGDELNGVEIIRRVLEALDPRHLRGSVLALPIVNVFGFVNQTRYLPDRRDLNRSFPGSKRGSLTGRLAHLFTEEVILKSTVGLDLHTAARDRLNLPQTRGDFHNPVVENMAQAFGAPIMLHSGLIPGSVRHAAAKRGVPVLVYEGGEALRFNDDAIAIGVHGVLRVMDHLGMTDHAERAATPGHRLNDTTWLRAPRGGILHLKVSLSQRVFPHQPVAQVQDAYGAVGATLRARRGGIVIGLATNPVVHQGDAVAHLAQENNGHESKPIAGPGEPV